MAKTASPANSDVLSELRVLQDRVVERIRELEPYMEELTSLREQAERMGIDLAEQKPARRAASKTTGTRKATGTRSKRGAARPRRRRRNASGGSRADQVLQLVREQPGITIPDLGTALGVDSTGLYRVVRNLEEDGKVRKEGRQVQPVAQADAADGAPDEKPVAADA